MEITTTLPECTVCQSLIDIQRGQLSPEQLKDWMENQRNTNCIRWDRYMCLPLLNAMTEYNNSLPFNIYRMETD